MQTPSLMFGLVSAGMSRSGVVALIVGIAAAVVLAVASTSDAPRLAARGPSFDFDVQLPQQSATTTTAAPPAEPATRGDQPPFVQIVLTALAAVLVVWIGRALVRAWSNRPRWLWRPPSDVDFSALDPAVVVAVVAAEATALQATLHVGTPRNAIVQCWARLEAVIIAAGVPRLASDTPTDLVARTLASLAVDPLAIGELAALYREARFSSHPLGEPQRQAAIVALDSVRAELEAGRVEPARQGARP